jgi:hypothetical protein
MGNVRVAATGAVTPERFVEALTDFSDKRSEIWGNSDDGYLTVHDRGPDWVEVTEGSSAGIWQRARYDWSKPGVVRLDVVDSNAFGKGSFWEYRIGPDGPGRSRVELFIHRQPTSLKGRVVDVLLLPVGNWYFRRDLRRTLRRLEGA